MTDNERHVKPVRYRRAVIAQRLLFGLFVGFPFVGILLNMIAPTRWLTLMIPYMLAYAAAGIFMMGVAFPNCGNAYFKNRFGVWNPCARSCRNCGTP
ncbi:MAG: hypothetical protein ACJ8F7_17760 [Gemmataceae bacterium]